MDVAILGHPGGQPPLTMDLINDVYFGWLRSSVTPEGDRHTRRSGMLGVRVAQVAILGHPEGHRHTTPVTPYATRIQL